jgi:hypothetical protein
MATDRCSSPHTGWDGNGWTVVPSPRPNDLSSSLSGVSGRPGEIWAVGRQNGNGADTLAMRQHP